MCYESKKCQTWSPTKSITAAVVGRNILFPVISSWIWRYTWLPVYILVKNATTSKYLRLKKLLIKVPYKLNFDKNPSYHISRPNFTTGKNKYNKNGYLETKKM